MLFSPEQLLSGYWYGFEDGIAFGWKILKDPYNQTLSLRRTVLKQERLVMFVFSVL
jgi:hypothetical protein